MLIGAAIILSTIAPVPTFAEFEKTERDVQDLYKQCTYKGSLDEIFRWWRRGYGMSALGH